MTKAALKELLAEFRAELKQNSTPERAIKEKSYLKSSLDFMGASIPAITSIAKQFKRNHKELERNDMMQIAAALWASRYHQERTLALKLIRQYPAYLDPEIMPTIERMLGDITDWAHLDETSVQLVGPVLKKYPDQIKYLRKWVKSENFWIRRASMLSQLLPFRVGLGDRELFYEFARSMLHEKEFFIRKAIGWTLRELSRKHPQEVYEFLISVRDQASGLTMREGSRLLPNKLASALYASSAAS